ncbi:sorting nexin-11 [Acanthochromis polyacanthus]|uniref:sorting nexin-11 n=1 Tax=Acanthochromis polyacanthus TaxID=80966 RepID=UPI0022348B4C|nr:sorting nexin-11 [Acanthochromis polyacanthus]XP_051795493.1 sorting nexin-11 [Acanthochromis polyacanthus]
MIRHHEEDEFVAVRVQDPRIQNEGSWNSYVDFKIFLHTNSKAFTAKTSCVRRRYSEFVWLRKKLQKNAGLVPVPDLPGKSLFSFSNEDFLERRRKGLQVFLDKVVHTTVCLSDSQLHLFLQTQLPVGHIQDCVQGHTPYSVTDAILTYASSNRGLAQAQEDDSIKEPSLTVSYESMESPAPHQPSTQTNETFSPQLLSCGDSEPLEGLTELSEQESVEILQKKNSSIRISQKSNHLEAVIEDCQPSEAAFYLGESPSSAEGTQHRSCQIQTPVEVHSPMGSGFDCGVEEEVEHPDTQENRRRESDNNEPEKCANSVVILDLKDSNSEEQVAESSSQEEEVLEDLCSENQILGNHVISAVNEGHAADVDDKTNEESGNNEEMPLQPESHDGAHNVNDVPEVMRDGDDKLPGIRDKQELDLMGTKDESDEDSLPSSNESIVKVSDEESLHEDTEYSVQAANGFMKASPEDVAHWSAVEASSRNILDLQMNGCPEEKEDIPGQDDLDNLQYVTNIGSLSKSLDVHSTVTDGDLTENSDISILETSCVPGLADSKFTEQEALSSLSLDASEETQEVELR